jgi:hypothetical protein
MISFLNTAACIIPRHYSTPRSLPGEPELCRREPVSSIEFVRHIHVWMRAMFGKKRKKTKERTSLCESMLPKDRHWI